MAGQTTAQAFSGGIASNPANGITNLPLNAAGSSSGVSPDELLKLLKEFIAVNHQQTAEFKPRFEDVITRLTRPDIIDPIQKIMNAIDLAQDPRKRTKDPNTNQYDPTAQELAQRLVGQVETMKDNKQEKTSAVFNLRTAQNKKTKKKTRGNPFRVLMGKVGKLLDHGLEKREITRYLLKQKAWNEETISRAIDIVRDYNKKKRRDGDDDKKTEKKSAIEQGEMRVAAKQELAQEAKPDFNKRSTAELMARATWLMSLKKYGKDTPQGDGKKAADTKGASAELKNIREALTARGFDIDELKSLGID